jgi:GH24 family phage-related lysozyme (muramidase)
MVILKSPTLAASSSRKKTEDWSEYPLLTAKGIELIKRHTQPRTNLGMGRFASYMEYGENIWRIGYGSKKLGKRWVGFRETATRKEIDLQLVEDLKEFSTQIQAYIYVTLNKNRKAAILSFAHNLGLASFKNCRLLELINRHASKNEIIREWSPYINEIWRSGGESIINRRRAELDTFLAADKEIPTFTEHNCKLKTCLLNLPETYTGVHNQIRAIEYLEGKILSWDPSGNSMKHFFRLWNEKPSGLGSPPRPGIDP